MAKSKQISLVAIACAHSASGAQRPCKQPATANCVEPYLIPDDAYPNQEAPWDLWKLEHEKTYNSAEEEAYRFGVWTNNTVRMMAENEILTFSLGWNSRSDLTEAEVAEIYGLNNPRNNSLADSLGTSYRGRFIYDGKLTDLPSDWDWSMADMEVVTYVKYQHCGDCWAFSATACLEGALAVANGWTDSLSPQQFVDCSSAGTCGGGNEVRAMDWAKNNFACSFDSYPETGSDGSCDWNCYQVITAGSIWGTYDITHNDEGSLCSALMQRPIAVAVAADGTFQAYKTGIMSYTALLPFPNHAILAVGWGYWDGAAYWKVKNSWGTSWGLDGYALLARGGGWNQNKIMSQPAGVYVHGPYNPSLHLTDLNGARISAPKTPSPVMV